MRKDITDIANRLIPKPSSIEQLQPEYITDDIIKAVLSQFEKSKQQLKNFAGYLKGFTDKETCYNIWHFWRSNITYVRDDAEKKRQLAKSPAATWADKFCDCKSFSIATMCCLCQLGIKGVFRFVSYNPDAPTIPTHVYVAAFDKQGNEIKIDCCLPTFNMEKPYTKKYDYLPQGLYAVTGVGTSFGSDKRTVRDHPIIKKKKRKKFPFGIIKAVAKFTPAGQILNKVFHHKKRGKLSLAGVENDKELALLIEKQKLELEQNLAAKVHGIGSPYDNAYEIELAAINNAICDIANPRLRKYFRYVQLKPAASVVPPPLQREGIGKAKKADKKLEKAKKKNAAGKAVNKKQAKKLEKLGITVQKKKEGILKKIAKVVTAPIRLAQKGIIEATLPKSAPAFLYLFITDQRVLAKAPKVVINKRTKAQAYADRVINKTEMKKDHFMSILRNGIMANMGDTPENILAQWMRDANFQIGIIDEVMSAAGPFLAKLLGGKAADLMADAPDPNDWITESSQARNDMATTVQNQASNNSPTSGNPSVQPEQMNQQQQQYGNQPSYSSGGGSGTSSFSNSEPEFDKSDDDDDGEGEEAGGGKTLENVTIKAKPKEDNTMMYAGLGLLALVALGTATRPKKKSA